MFTTLHSASESVNGIVSMILRQSRSHHFKTYTVCCLWCIVLCCCCCVVVVLCVVSFQHCMCIVLCVVSCTLCSVLCYVYCVYYSIHWAAASLVPIQPGLLVNVRENLEHNYRWEFNGQDFNYLVKANETGYLFKL